jgi:hypothetical protein
MGKLLLSYVTELRRVVLAVTGLLVLVTVVMVSLFMSSPALAMFTRPYITQLSETPTGPSGEEVPLSGVDGIAIELSSPGHVWVGEGGTGLVDEFSSSNTFIPPQLTGFSTGSLAFDDRSGKLEGTEGKAWVAADNSIDPTDPAEGDVYHASDGLTLTGFEVGAVSRTNAEGEPAPFTCSEGLSDGYIDKEGDLVGSPGEIWKNGSAPPIEAIAVDSSSGKSAGDAVGDFYIIHTEGFEHEVDQFTSAGCFVGAFTGTGTPTGPFGRHELRGVAVDPSDGDVLVEVKSPAEGGDVVDEFSSSGVYLGQVIGVPGGAQFGVLPGGVAVSSGGNLYVGVKDELGTFGVVDEFGPGGFYPDVSTGGVSNNEPVAGGEGRAVLHGLVDDEGLALSECDFQFVEAREYEPGTVNPYAAGGSVGCEPDAAGVPADKGHHGVSGTVSGLRSGVVYDYRLVARTVGEHGGMAVGDDESFAAADVPVVEGESAGGVLSSSVVFGARVDPLGVDTSYWFEYVSVAGYEAAMGMGAADPFGGGGRVPVPAGDVGAGDGFVSVSVPAGGLVPSTAYRFRVVASNSVGTTLGEVGSFMTLPVSSGGGVLPDGRGYELLTPPNKEDAEDLFGGPPDIESQDSGEDSTDYDSGYASGDGNHFLLDTEAAFGSFPTTGEDSYVFSRGKTGWTFESVASPGLGVQSGWASVYNFADFSVVCVHDTLGLGESVPVLSLLGPPGGPYGTVASGAYHEPVEAVGASADLSRLVVESKDHKQESEDHTSLWCESAQRVLAEKLDAGSNGLYEWSSERRCLSLVDVKSKAEGGGLVSQCGAVLGQGGAGDIGGAAHGAVSADGSKIFFTAPDPLAESKPGCWNTGVGEGIPQLYVREDGKIARLSEPEKNVVSSEEPAVYVGASEDGSKVFFITRAELTSATVKLGTRGPELYECEVVEGSGSPKCKLTRISGGESGNVEGNVENVPAVSADGSSVYFNAAGRLTSKMPKSGGPYLYRYDTVTGVTTYVAPAGGYPALHEPQTSWYGKAVLGERVDVAGLWVKADYYTTGDGRFLVFPSTQNITGYDSGGESELYRYDADSPVSEGVSGVQDNPLCISCNPGGSLPFTGASFTRSAMKDNNPAGTAPRPISENGEYVFFDTAESLVPQDTDGKVDVYEWKAYKAEEPYEAGSCRERAGCVSLITTGQEPTDAFLLDSSSYVDSTNGSVETVEGGDVFFGAHAKLVPQDNDEEGDLYDARIRGGFTNVTETRPCEGDACDNPPPAPIDQTPASLTFSGSGNVQSVPEVKVKSKQKSKSKSKKKSKKMRGSKSGKRGKGSNAKHAKVGHARGLGRVRGLAGGRRVEE